MWGIQSHLSIDKTRYLCYFYRIDFENIGSNNPFIVISF